MDGIVALLLSKKFTKDTVIGMGAIKGAACQVQSINKVGKTTTITLKWEDNVGTSHTQSFDIEDGLDGVSVTGATIKPNGHLELTLSNGNSIDCGQVLPQYNTMPTPSASNEGQILQYIGTTTSNYTNGYFYECINDGGIYKWVEKSVQDSYTKGQIGSLSDLPDDSKNVIENIADIKLSVDQLSASKLSISDIDNALSNVSENPVQNKVIKLTIDQLKGSILDKLNEKENKFRYSTMPIASVDNVDQIVEYIGVTDTTYTNGYFYQCRFDGTNYEWIQKNIQPSGGSTGGDGVVDGYYNSTDHLFYEEAGYINPIAGDSNTLYVSLDTNLLYRYNGLIFIRVDESSSGEDDVIDGYYNTTDHKFYEESTYVTEIVGETGKIYISDDTNIQYRWDGTQFVTISSSITIDSDLSTTSENPVQNKVITLELDALKATVLTKSDVDNALSDTSENPVQNKVIKVAIDNIDLLLASKVDKETGKGLSSNDFTDVEKEKLSNLQPIYLIGSGLNLDTTTGELTASGIDVPIDDELSTTSINPVQNKVITLELDALKGSVLNKIQKKLSAQADDFSIFTSDGDIADSGISKNIVPTTASVSNKLLVASDLSVKADKVSGAVDNDIALLDGTGNLKDSTKKLSDLQDKLTEGNGIDIDTNNKISVDISYLTASRVGYIPSSEKGAHSGVAELDSTGKVPSSQLPSYVDDVIDGYYNETDGKFYEESTYTTEIVGESGKIYISVDTDIQYRWTGSAFAALGGALQLGETSSTAYRGDRGKIAYDHSQITNGSNPHETKADVINLKVPIPALSGSKLDVESTLYGINTALGEKADKVSSATNGHLAGLDGNGNLTDSGVVASNVIEKVATATGLLKDDGTVDTTTYAPSANAYLVEDTAETTIDDADYFPFYDTSATAKKKTLWLNIKEKIKAYFDSIYATIGLLKDTVGWTGKNLNGTKYVASALGRNGIDWTYNSETGIVTANGTSTDKSTFGADAKYSFTAPYSSQVILSGCSNADSNVHIYPYDTTTNSRPYKDSTKTSVQNANVYNGEEVSFYMEAGHNYIMPCRINATGITVNEFKFYPMLRKAEISDSTFEPYHKDVVDTLRDAEVIEGKNLFDGRDTTFSNSGITVEPQNDGTYLLTGTRTGTGGKLLPIGNFTCKAEMTYILSGCPTGGNNPSGYWLAAYSTDSSSSSTYGGTDVGSGIQITTFTVDTEVQLRIRIPEFASDGVTKFTCPQDFIWKPMICALDDWNKSHDYEPYYIPVKDAMLRRTEQRILGAKNLLPLTVANLKSINTDGTWNDNTYSYSGVTYTVNTDSNGDITDIDVDTGGSASSSASALRLWGNASNIFNGYILNGCPTGGSSTTYTLLFYDIVTNITTRDNGEGLYITAPNGNSSRVAIRIDSGQIISHKKFYPMIRLASDPDDTYVPYAMTNKELTKCVTWKDV